MPHIDINPTDRYQDAELEQLLPIDARPADVGSAAEESRHVLQHPDGNEFWPAVDSAEPVRRGSRPQASAGGRR